VTDTVRDEITVRGAAAANLALRFLLELLALAALAYWGVHTGGSPAADVALGAGAPLAAASLWARYAAPRSARRLRGPARAGVELSVLGAGALGLAAAGHPLLAAAFAAVVLINAVLLHVGEENAT
jgi:hypothetical protein